MTNNTTTSIRIPLDQYIKIKTEKINLSQLVTKFLDDYFIEDEEQFELKELEEEKEFIGKKLKELQSQEMKLLSQITKKKEELRKKAEEKEKLNYQRTMSMKAINPMRFPR